MEDWRKNKRAFAVFIGPATFWLLMFFTIPVVVIWIYSFGERGPLGQTYLAFSFDNYLRAIEPIHLKILWKSIWIGGLSTFLCLVIGFPVALGIAFAPDRWKNPLLLVVVLPFFTNMLIRTFAWIVVLGSRGIVNTGLGWMHGQMDWLFTLAGQPDLMGQFTPLGLLYNNSAVIVGLVYVHLPFLILPLYATLEKLDRSYLEASLDLGAGQWRTFFSVLAPLAMPGIVTGCMLVFILSMGNFLIPDRLGGTDSLMIGNLIAQEFNKARDWPFGAALSFVVMYPVFIFFAINALTARRRERARAET
jgi:spermidine/putrescine transport system permease protein